MKDRAGVLHWVLIVFIVLQLQLSRSPLPGSLKTTTLAARVIRLNTYKPYPSVVVTTIIGC